MRDTLIFLRINLPLFSTVVPASVCYVSVLWAFRCYNNIINRSCGCWSHFWQNERPTGQKHNIY